MRIAINTRFQGYTYLEGYGHFTRFISMALVEQCPSDQFDFIYDQQPVHTYTAPNLWYFVLKPAARHPLLWKFWFDYRIPALLRRRKSSVFFSTDGFCSLRTAVPQVMVMHDLAFLHHPRFLPASQQYYYRKYTPAFLKKAKKIITVSNFSREDIIAHYPFVKDKIEVVYNSADPLFIPATEGTKEEIREKFTEGKEFFLYVGSIHPRKNLVHLLKAFSSFKKRQQTNMQLVIAGRMAWKNDDFTKVLSTFKFRNEVKLTGYLEQQELIKLMGSAYALVYPSLWEGFGLPVLEAMCCGVPVLCSGNSALPEIAGDAALYFNPADPDEITKQMALVYKDEVKRVELIQKGLARAKAFSWQASAIRIREILEDAVKGGGIP